MKLVHKIYIHKGAKKDKDDDDNFSINKHINVNPYAFNHVCSECDFFCVCFERNERDRYKDLDACIGFVCNDIY